MLSRVPVIFLSAYGRDQIIAQALEAGADDYIVKPFSPTELVGQDSDGPAPAGCSGNCRGLLNPLYRGN